MRRALLAAAGLCLTLTACGSTVPLTSQGTALDGTGQGGPRQPGVGGTGDGLTSGSGATTAGTASTGGGSATGGTTGTVPGQGGTGGSGPGATSGGVTGTTTGAGLPATTVDYSKPATGSPVDVGMMYIRDLGAAATQFGGSEANQPDQTGYMKAAVAWMNAHGGLGGHKINLVLYGAEIAGAKSYDQSLQEMCAMMTQDHKAVAAVISNITVTNNMAACMQKSKGLYVTDGGYMKGASDWATYSYMASPSELDAEVLGRRMAQHMISTGAAKRGDTVGLVVYDAPGFHAAEAQFLKVAKAAGIEVVNYAVHYASSTPDLANSISAVQSATLAMQSRGAKVVASLSSGGIMGYFLKNAEQQKYYPRYLLSSNDNFVGAPAAAAKGQLKGAFGIGTMPVLDVNLYEQPGQFVDPTDKTCRAINRPNRSVVNATNFIISQRVCQALLLVQTAAKGYGGTNITGTTLRDGLGRLGASISAGTTYKTLFTPGKLWAPSHYRPLRFDEAKNQFVYVAGRSRSAEPVD